MPILIVFVLTASCLPAPWPAPPFGLGPGGSAALMAAAVILPLMAAFALRGWAIRAVRRDPAMAAFHAKLLARGKAAKSALCAVAHKVLRQLMGKIKEMRHHQAHMPPLAA